MGQPVGVYAREQGALVPTNWCTRPSPGSRIRTSIAPRRSCRGMRRRPGACSRRWKSRRASSPNSATPGTRRKGAPLAEQDVVLTVPASFDEEARELTVMAARDAGIEKLTLLEEPAAAFYSWIANNLAAVAQEAVRRPDRAGLRRRRRHQRFHADPRIARRRPGRFHAHRGGQAPAAGRRQSGSDAGLAGGIQARQAALHPAAQRPAPAMRGGQGEAALRSRI